MFDLVKGRKGVPCLRKQRCEAQVPRGRQRLPQTLFAYRFTIKRIEPKASRINGSGGKFLDSSMLLSSAALSASSRSRFDTAPSAGAPGA